MGTVLQQVCGVMVSDSSKASVTCCGVISWMCWCICHNASIKVPLTWDRQMLNSKLWGQGRKQKPGLLAEKPGKAVFLLSSPDRHPQVLNHLK